MTGVLEEPNRILRNLVLTVHSVVSVKVTHDAPNAGYELRRTAPSPRWPCSAAPLGQVASIAPTTSILVEAVGALPWA
jgi:hypothetical protein